MVYNYSITNSVTFEGRVTMNRIRERRDELKLTRKELANRIGTTQTSIFRYENGTRNVPLKKMVAIADALGCKVDDLIVKEE